ncbi:MAG: DUF4105 domain-containing protein, partial [Pseudobdellovibrionaceae bacterium]
MKNKFIKSIFFILSLALFTSTNCFANSFIASDANLSPKENEVLKILDKDLQQVLPEKIKISLKKRNPKWIIQFFNNDQRHVFAAYNKRSFFNDEILINRLYLKRLSQMPDFGKRTPVSPIEFGYSNDYIVQTGHKTFYNYILATLVHESIHVYDENQNLSEEIKNQIRLCEKEAVVTRSKGSGVHKTYKNNQCLRLVKMRYSISSDPLFLNAAGFPEQSLTDEVTANERSNFLEFRSPDAYEWKNPQEALAVNSEYFFLDPEYKCRRPGLYQVLSLFFDTRPFENFKCDATRTVLVPPNVLTKTSARLQVLDPSRIYAIHYLFAGKGPKMMSKFGHAMLRLVICAPDRKVVDAQCVMDINHHLVVSFRASVEDFQIDSIKGLNGDYPSIEFVLPLSTVIDEYTKKELRWIKSLPLILSESEKNFLLQSVIESQWSYEGKYRFLSNNCADETLQLLKRGLPFNNNMQEITISRPDTLF